MKHITTVNFKKSCFVDYETAINDFPEAPEAFNADCKIAFAENGFSLTYDEDVIDSRFKSIDILYTWGNWMSSIRKWAMRHMTTQHQDCLNRQYQKRIAETLLDAAY